MSSDHFNVPSQTFAAGQGFCSHIGWMQFLNQPISGVSGPIGALGENSKESTVFMYFLSRWGWGAPYWCRPPCRWYRMHPRNTPASNVQTNTSPLVWLQTLQNVLLFLNFSYMFQDSITNDLLCFRAPQPPGLGRLFNVNNSNNNEGYVCCNIMIIHLNISWVSVV